MPLGYQNLDSVLKKKDIRRPTNQSNNLVKLHRFMKNRLCISESQIHASICFSTIAIIFLHIVAIRLRLSRGIHLPSFND